MKTAHRLQSLAKRNQRYTGLLPKFWRPSVTASQQLDCKPIHWDLIARFTDGSATPEDLWDWMETGYTYSQIMRLLAESGVEFTGEAMAAIGDQMDIYAPIVERWKRTGRVGFSGPELCVAKAAAHVMDALIELDRFGIAEQAAIWSAEQMARIRVLHGQGVAA